MNGKNMTLPPTNEAFMIDRNDDRVDIPMKLRDILTRWLSVTALVCLAIGMILPTINIKMSSIPVMMLALPKLEMTGKQVFGPLGMLSLSFNVLFVLVLFFEKWSKYLRSLGFATITLWLSSLVLAAVEVNTSFEAMLATISVLNRGDTAPDLTAQLKPMLGLLFSLIELFLVIVVVILCRKTQ